MGFFKSLELELYSLAGMFNILKQDEKLVTSVNIKEEYEPEVKPIEVVSKKNVSARVKLPQVQHSIEYFNNLPSDKKINILENCDQKLQDKLMVFMNYNAQFTDNIDKTNFLFKNLYICVREIAERKSYTDKELAVMLKDFQRFAAKSNIEADRLVSAFMSYRINSEGESIKMSSDNKDEQAISTAISFKKSISSYMSTINSKLKMVQTVLPEQKADAMTSIVELINTIKLELDDFQSTALELMNAFIPEAINEENKFYARTNRYVEKGIELDLCLENKIVENLLIDTIIEAANIAFANAA